MTNWRQLVKLIESSYHLLGQQSSSYSCHTFHGIQLGSRTLQNVGQSELADKSSDPDSKTTFHKDSPNLLKKNVTFAVIEQLFVSFCKSFHDIQQLPQIALFNTTLDKFTCLFCEDHSALLKDVKWSIEQNTVRLFVISASTTTFLIEILHGFAQGVMNYKAYVWLINAHSKCYCSYHNLRKQNKKKIPSS